MTPKYPIGTLSTCAIGDWAELSQLKNALMSQNEPAKMVVG